MPFLEDLATGGVGAAVSGVASAWSARNQMRFQERMRDTEVQARARDLEKAGFNRVLAVGDGASSPAGAGFEVPDPVASAVSARRAKAEIGLMEKQGKLTDANAERARAETGLITEGRIPGGMVGTRGMENLRNAFSWIPGLAGNLREHLAGKVKDKLNAEAIRRNKETRRRMAASAKRITDVLRTGERADRPGIEEKPRRR